MDVEAHQFTPEKLAEVQEVFSLFDKDQDGFVSIHRLGAILRSVGYNSTEGEIEYMTQRHEARVKVSNFGQFSCRDQRIADMCRFFRSTSRSESCLCGW